MSEKNILREKYIKIRKSQELSKIKKSSEKIIENLKCLDDFKVSRKILFYISFDNEVNTHEIIKDTLNKKIIGVPIIKNNKVNFVILKDFLDTEANKFGILEPRIKKRINIENVDIIIVPGIVFDKRGHRIGYGNGYYDVFLEKTKALKIGLCYDFCLLDNISNLKHDMPVDIVITEEKIIRCNK